MKISVNQRSVLIVILAIIFLLALLNGIMQPKEQDNQPMAVSEQTISQSIIKTPKSNKSAKAAGLNSPLYINHASVTEIAKRLKGVGKKIAQRIVNAREDRGDFKRLEDLKAVPGMGVSKIEANKEIISFDLPLDQ